MRNVLRRIAHVQADGTARSSSCTRSAGCPTTEIATRVGMPAASVRWSLDRTRGPLEEPVIAS